MPLNIILLPLTLYLDYSQAVMPLNITGCHASKHYLTMLYLPITLYTLLRLLTGCHASKHYLTTFNTT